MDHLFTVDNLIALVTLTSLEIVLGIDNIVFIAILTGRLPEQHRKKARMIGLGIAMFARIALLLTIGWLMGLKEPLFHITLLAEQSWSPYILNFQPSLKDLILLVGGMFLLAKATVEIHHKIEGGESATGHTPDPSRGLEGTDGKAGKRAPSFKSIIFQILMIDLVFSIDSVITAVGMAKEKSVMVAAVIIAVIVMMVFAGKVSGFIEKHPTMKMLALSFLMLIGLMLIVEGIGGHIDKGYIYFAMAFSLVVEMLNLRLRKRAAKVPAH
ncbi:MAG: TerC family protein [Pyrinomonadaceae bacterium]|nr:TerC family protein [Phycisphaerales bacterium]